MVHGARGVAASMCHPLVTQREIRVAQNLLSIYRGYCYPAKSSSERNIMHKLAASADPDNPKIKNFDLLGDTDYKVRITKGDGGCVSCAALPVRRIENNPV